MPKLRVCGWHKCVYIYINEKMPEQSNKVIYRFPENEKK